MRTGLQASPKLRAPENISLPPLPPYAPKLNSVKQVWAILRANVLSRRAWNKRADTPERLASTTRRTWARAVNG